MRPERIVMWLFITLAVIIVIVSVTMGIITNEECKDICDSKGAISHLRIENGEWNFKDYCTCFYKDSTETFQLN